MDEAASTREDEAVEKPRNADTPSEINVGPSAEDSADRVGVFYCRDCGEAFREETAFLEHGHQHPPESVYLDNQLDGLHEAEKDIEMDNFCNLCSLSFVEPSEFHFHMENNHGQTSQQETGVQISSGITKQQTYECPECGKCYGVFGHFLNHQRSHKQASKSVFHDLEQLKKKSFQCETCGRNYSRASALDAHRRCHEEKLIKSQNRRSGDAFHTEESTVEAKPSENQADDTPEKLFECSCGKAFTALMRLKTHQRFSRKSECSPEKMKEKQPKKISNEFYCSECNKAFNGHIALFNHQRWHANHSNDSAKRFTCEECGKEFMTLTFYYRHQRMAHSNEAPAKSFLHQVCQLQKKAFECKDCGLKFSRASALHSHQLQHSDIFKETEKETQMCTSLLPQQNTLESERKETEQEQVESETVLPDSLAEEDLHVNDTDEDMDSYELGDFNVLVISASESEDESSQDLNPDLELLCESDQEVRDDGDTEVSLSSFVLKPEMDLKIVQIDYGQAEVQCAPIAETESENVTTEARFDCPDCYRWFTSASSLRVHRMWHGLRKRRHHTQVIPFIIACKDCGVTFTNREVYETHLHQHALEEGEEEEEEAETRVDSMKYSGTQKFYTCSVCGKIYLYLNSFVKHQMLHEKPSSTTKSGQKLRKYECPDCGMSFIRRVRLISHLRVHRSNGSLKSKPPRCDQCNEDFPSVKALMAHVVLHKQKPYWCLSCAEGFEDEDSLNKHLNSLHLKKDTGNSSRKSLHDEAKPYHCTFCRKGFFHIGNLIAHRKNHVRIHVGANGKTWRHGLKRTVCISKKRIMNRKRRNPSMSEKDLGMDTDMDELTGEEDGVEEIESPHPLEDAECVDWANCGEPGHSSEPSESPDSSSSDPTDESDQELDEIMSQETNVPTEQKEWEWECCVCDMGFDEVAKLHLHYIKHATGELPM